MHDLLIVICRWIFMAIIACFLLLGGHYILSERGITRAGAKGSAARQRILIVLMHVLGFAILLLRDGAFDVQSAVIGGLSLLFLLFAMFASGKIYRDSDPLLWNAMLFLLDMGFIILTRLKPADAQRQLLIAFLGFVVMLVVPLALKIVPRFEKLKWVYLVVGLLMLAAVFVSNTTLFGSQNWLSLGVLTFQPSELVKLLFVFYLASVMHEPPKGGRLMFVCGTGAAFVLVLVLQKDLGGALIFFMTFMIMLYTSTGKAKLVGLGVGLAAVAAYVSHMVFDHVQTRVSVWQDPWADISNKGFQITQSLFAITTRGLLGSGLSRGGASAIPVVERDFIFSAICEEFGVLFALMLIGVLILLFYRGVHIALRCQRPLYALLSVGLTSILAFQTFIIIGGDINLIPMTGVTLPFVSYGGTSVFICVLMVGVLQWLYTMIPVQDKARRKRTEQLDKAQRGEEKHMPIKKRAGGERHDRGQDKEQAQAHD